ncbi:MAG: LysM peptidoglycan-binding domain-containing protein [Clostridia bacterium]|nr:LysM peptidoglycan-binding domain-containing protein [Clostridia bacterium]
MGVRALRVALGGRRFRIRLGRLVAVALAVAGWLVAMGLWAAQAAPPGPPAARVYVVQPGDTLWSIATRLAPAEDPRAWIARVMERNGLSSPVIRPGEALALPDGR